MHTGDRVGVGHTPSVALAWRLLIYSVEPQNTEHASSQAARRVNEYHALCPTADYYLYPRTNYYLYPMADYYLYPTADYYLYLKIHYYLYL